VPGRLSLSLVGGVRPAARPEGEERGRLVGREEGARRPRGEGAREGAREEGARGPREEGRVVDRREWDRPKVGAAMGLETGLWRAGRAGADPALGSRP
jgi:hypothetical protein